MARITKQNTYYTPEKWESVNPNNKKLLDSFLRFCRSTDKSPDTIISYESNLRIFILWLMKYADNKDFTDIIKLDILNFQDWMLTDQGLSSNRVRQVKSTISSCSDYICDMLDTQFPNFRNIVNKIKAPPLQAVRKKTILSNEQVENLLNKLVELKKYNHACLVACLAASGVRKGEIVQFKVDFFTDEKYDKESGFYITPEIRTKGAGKQGKRMTRFVIKDIVYPYLELWLKDRERLGIDSEYLFVHKRKGEWIPDTKSTVDSYMLTFSKMLDEDIYAHCLRHYSATWLKRNGVDISKIRDFLGHNDSSTTEIYIDIGTEENLKDMLNFMKEL